MTQISYKSLFHILVLTYNLSDAYKLLVVFPFPGKSHGILGEAYVKTLLKAGHEVTYIASVPIKNPLQGLRQIDMSSNFVKYDPTDKFLTIEAILNNEMSITEGYKHFSLAVDMMEGTIYNKDVQALMMDPKEQFDAVIIEWMYSELYSGFSAAFGCPLIWSSSMEPHSLVMSLIDDNLNPAYIPDHMSHAQTPMNFFERVGELFMISFLKFTRWRLHAREVEVFNQGYGPAIAKRGWKVPSYDEVKYNGSLMLGNSHVSSGYAHALPQNYKPIGGYHIERETKPLPENWLKIMEKSPHGVIYFSLGSMIKSKKMPEQMKMGILNVLKTLKQTVIWKFEEELPGTPDNIHIIDWAPQQSILAHPNCILFITHGGLLSTTEALHFGVPLIGIPIFADQFLNVNRAVQKGFAKRVDLAYDMEDELKSAINDILQNSSYARKAKDLSFVYHHRPVLPTEELVHWVEHVIKTRGAPHLRSLALNVPFYQKAYLDLIAVLLILVTIITHSVKFLIKCLFRSKTDFNKKNK